MQFIKNFIDRRKQKLFYINDKGKNMSYKELTSYALELERRSGVLEECLWLIRRHLDDIPETDDVKRMKEVIDDYDLFDDSK